MFYFIGFAMLGLFAVVMVIFCYWQVAGPLTFLALLTTAVFSSSNLALVLPMFYTKNY